MRADDIFAKSALLMISSIDSNCALTTGRCVRLHASPKIHTLLVVGSSPVCLLGSHAYGDYRHNSNT